MPQRSLVFIVAFLFALLPPEVTATPACQPLMPEAFSELAAAADVVVDAVVLGSRNQPGDGAWTDIRIQTVLRGDVTVGDVIRVSGWAGDDPPLFYYTAGTPVALLLTSPAPGEYTLADDSWKKCVPGILPVAPDTADRAAAIRALAGMDVVQE